MLSAALLLLLLAPARVVLRAFGDTGDGIEVALSWRLLLLHGARRRRLALTAGAPSAPQLAAAPPPARLVAATADPRSPSPPRATRSARSGRFDGLERTVGLVRRLVARRALRVARLDGWLEFALHDVGETGRAFGFLCALATLLDPLGRFTLQPRWDTEDRLAADVELELRVQPLRTLLVLLGDRLRRRAASAPSPESSTAGGPVAA